MRRLTPSPRKNTVPQTHADRSAYRLQARCLPRFHRIALSAGVFCWCLVGCTSIDKQVRALSDAKKFDEALVQLEKEGAGAVVTTKASPNALAARLIFQTAMEENCRSEVDSALAQGFARQALERSETATKICAWSAAIEALNSANRSRVGKIDALFLESEKSIGSAGNRILRRVTLTHSASIKTMLEDSPACNDALARARDVLVNDCCQAVVQIRGTTPAFRKTLEADLVLAGCETKTATSVSRMLGAIETLTGANRVPANSLLEYARSRAPLSTALGLSVLVAAADEQFAIWASRCAARSFPAVEVDYPLIHGLREVIDLLAGAPKGACVPLLGRALLIRAGTLSADTACAPLAWAYLEGARLLYETIDSTKPLEQNITNALQESEPFRATIAIDLPPTIDPRAYPIFYLGLFDAVGRASRERVDWNWIDPVHETPTIVLKIDEGKLFEASSTDLQPKTSTYLSHYEDVPNPRKAQLERSLESQKYSVSSAESSYESAVRSHNSYPTEWSLLSANLAKTNYLSALNQYNSLVNAYNATPDTISQPVFLPYTYRAGAIQSGFSLKGSIVVAGRARPLDHQQIATDSVKLGTKFSDTNSENRRDDPVDIDLSGAAQMHRLKAIGDSWATDLAVALVAFPRQTRVELSSEERQFLGWIDNPLGLRVCAADAAGAPNWLRESASKFKCPETNVVPPTIALTRRPVAASSDEEAQSVAIASTCEVFTCSPDGTPIGRGGGALISADGLILTCSHVLSGSNLKVRFLEGELKGEYRAVVVRANTRRDVALIRINGVCSKSWLEIENETPSRGTKIFAIGSPSLDIEGNVAHLAMTEGTIVTPLGEEWGQPRLVADVAIASGSSGGPILSASTGRILALVTAIAREQFSEERAATSAFCLGAPAALFDDWLGISYRATDAGLLGVPAP